MRVSEGCESDRCRKAAVARRRREARVSCRYSLSGRVSYRGAKNKRLTRYGYEIKNAYLCNMEKVYKSIVAKWYIGTCIALSLSFLGSIYLCYQSTLLLLIDVIFMGICLLIMYDILLHTDYTIKDDKLFIRCGVLFRQTLPISKISEITHKSTILSSPALSAKRIGLRHGKTNWVYVSPENQNDFIASLKSINSNIIETNI